MHATYLEHEVLSATPQRLRLMLIEGALRFARQTVEHWRRGEREAGVLALGRCREIVLELISSVRTERAACEKIVDQAGAPAVPRERRRHVETLHQIARNTAAIYLVILRELSEAQLRADSAGVEAAIRVLLVERETLRLVCEQLPHAPPAPAPQRPAEITSSQAAASLYANAPANLGGPPVYGEGAGPRGSLSLDG